MSYPLTEMKDRFGNTVSYEYDLRDNFYTPKKITYTNASVEFQYRDSRSDAPFFYQSGTKVTQNQLLTDIKCKYGSTSGTLIETDKLLYTQDINGTA